MQKQFRLPLAGPYTSRVSAVNASDTSTGYVGTGIVGLMVVGETASSTNKDSRFINCFAVTTPDPFTGKRRLKTVKRPGFGTQATPSAGNKGVALKVWTGSGSGTDIISAFGDTNSTVYNGVTSLGAITGKATSIEETFVSTTATLLVSSNDSTGWYYDTGAAVMTKISDGDFPGNAGKTLAGGFAVMDGYAAIMTTDGGLYASDLNSITGWTASSFDSANAYADKGVGCVRHGTFILAFGTESLQFFYNTGTTPFPFGKAIAKTAKVGAISYDAIAQISDTTFWCGSTPQGGLSIFQFDGSISRVSPPEIDAILLLAGASNITLTAIRFYGRSFVVVRAGPTTYVYCVEEKGWHEWNSTTPLWYKCAGVSLGGTMVNYAVSNVSTSGKVYLQNPASLVFTDDGTTYTARVQLAPHDEGTNRFKTCSSVEFIGDREIAASPLTISYSDDDYQTYTTHSTVDLSDARPMATRLGQFRRRGWVLSHSANTPMGLERMEGVLEIGS